VISIEIARRHYLLYLLLPHWAKVALLSPGSRVRLDRINLAFNDALYSGAGAEEYERIHRYADDAAHEYPARALVEEIWAAPSGYGRALELGAGSGYFTAAIARRAESVVAVEPVADMRAVIDKRCREAGVRNVTVLAGTALDLAGQVPDASIDTALVLQSLHHFHRRPEVFAALGRAVRPGGRLYLVEPHHNLRRVGRLLRKYATTYRRPAFWGDERNWATHDFLTRGEIRALCRAGGFDDVRITGYWIPFSRRIMREARRRFEAERRLGQLPLVRHLAAVLAVEARRGAGHGR
jgi:ubiquinone/menaquinone biosynthesis C-methylase UbiE